MRAEGTVASNLAWHNHFSPDGIPFYSPADQHIVRDGLPEHLDLQHVNQDFLRLPV